MAHGDIAVVSAYENLLALGDYIARAVYSCVYRGLSAASADRLYFRYTVRYFKKSLTAGKKLGLKIGAQAEAQHRYVKTVCYVFKPRHLLFG